MKRDTNRFYNYPPILPRINSENIFPKKEIGLYIHIPYCERICSFCPYNKYPKNEEQVKEYLLALNKEINLLTKKNSIQNTIVKVIFIGGGTPTCLSSEQLSDLINLIKEKFNIAKDCQITIEATPPTINKEKLKILKNSGVNRISLGVQTFNDKMLKLLGRDHDSSNALQAIKLSKEVGFGDINIDLMYRLPSQTLEDWKNDLQILMKTGTTHLSTYALDIVPRTAIFYRKQKEAFPKQPDLKLETQIFKETEKVLKEAGFKKYNVDFICKEGWENLYGIYVAEKEILGIGAGAFSYFNGFEFRNFLNPSSYIESLKENKLPIELGKRLSKKEQMERYVIKKIPYLEIDKKEFEKRFGIPINKIFYGKIRKLKNLGLIKHNEDKIRLTLRGKLFIYNVCKEFYSSEYLRIMRDIERFSKTK